MTPEQLKASILQRAMEGKLVPQDPNDEPASELLKRIKAEKEKLIKEGKIKRDKNETEIFRGDDGLHYEKFQDGTIERVIFDFNFPDTWELTRLRNIGNIISGGTPKTTEKSYYNGNIPWITPSDMGKQQNNIYFEGASKFISEKGLNNSSAQMIPANSIVYSSRAPIGHINIVNTEFTTNQGCKSIFPLLIDNEFLYWLLKNRTTDIQRRSSGTTFKEISGRSFGDTIVCIPPYQEQKRITRKISSILKNINNYEKYYVDLERLKQEFPEKLRKSILQYAMQGKLVPQNATDEPVEVLLEKIRKEKQRLFEEGKLKKKDLQESIIYQGDDNSYYEKKNKINIQIECPFRIPKTWKWVKLKQVANIFSGFSFKSSEYSDVGVRIIRISDFNSDGINDSKIVRQNYKQNFNNFEIFENDILIAMTGGTVGKNILIPQIDERLFLNQRIASIRQYYMNHNFIFLIINSPFIQKEINIKKNSTNDNISLDIIQNFFCPLPPEQEQKRIVSRIEKINFLINKI